MNYVLFAFKVWVTAQITVFIIDFFFFLLLFLHEVCISGNKSSTFLYEVIKLILTSYRSYQIFKTISQICKVVKLSKEPLIFIVLNKFEYLNFEFEHLTRALLCNGLSYGKNLKNLVNLFIFFKAFQFSVSQRFLIYILF